MSTSEKQIEANRRNAQLSTGPKTHEGKRRAAMNAMRHPLSGQVVCMTEEEKAAFTEFSRNLVASLDPVGAWEKQLAMGIARDSWRLNRIAALETNMFALGQVRHANEIDCDDARTHAALTAAITFSSEARRFAMLSRCEEQTNRSLHQNIDTLRQLQSARTPAPVSPKDEMAVSAAAGIPEPPSVVR